MPSTVDPRALQRATDAAVEAALDPEQWSVALAMLGAAANSTGAVMFLFGGRERSSFLCSDHCAGAMDEYLTSDWCLRNPRLSTPPGEITRSDADYMRDERQARDLAAFRDGFLRKHDMGWFAGTSLFRDGERQILISTERAFRSGAFQAGELRIIGAAFARLRRVVSLVPSLDARLRLALLNGFEGRGQASAILNRKGVLLGLNQAAETLLPKVLRIRHGCLRAAHPSGMSAWAAFIDRLTATAPYTSADALFRSAAVLLFFDEVKGRRIRPDMLRSMFHLTPAEARLAAELAHVFDLGHAGQALGIGRETARSHLKAIFAKTETASQAECIAKISKLS